MVKGYMLFYISAGSSNTMLDKLDKMVSGHRYLFTTQGPCPGVEFRTKFNIFSFFINVKEEIYCVDSEGIVVDCEMACRKPLCYMTNIFTVMVLLVSVNRKLKQIWVSIMHL